jgi:hypothetical protein
VVVALRNAGRLPELVQKPLLWIASVVT